MLGQDDARAEFWPVDSACGTSRLDALHHGPNWDRRRRGAARSRVARRPRANGWVADAHVPRRCSATLVLERADTVVWLDLPYALRVRRVVIRTWTRPRRRLELWNGNVSRLARARSAAARSGRSSQATLPRTAAAWPGRLAASSGPEGRAAALATREVRASASVDPGDARRCPAAPARASARTRRR